MSIVENDPIRSKWRDGVGQTSLARKKAKAIEALMTIQNQQSLEDEETHDPAAKSERKK